MRKLSIAMAFVLVYPFLLSSMQAQSRHPGAQSFTPTRIDWLVTSLQAALRQDLTEENGFLLDITHPDSETVLIFVRYLPRVDRTSMNMSIDTARKVISIRAKSYGWEDWLKIREDVQPGKTTN